MSEEFLAKGGVEKPEAYKDIDAHANAGVSEGPDWQARSPASFLSAWSKAEPGTRERRAPRGAQPRTTRPVSSSIGIRMYLSRRPPAHGTASS